ncbi:MAG: hypothetical protein ACFUZC_16755 [Chthoniobacteraceae bacterium]
MKQTLYLPLLFAVLSALSFSVHADSPAIQPIGGPSFSGWSGITPGADGGASAEAAVYRYPDGPLGQHKHGMKTVNDSTADWRPYNGLRFEARLERPAVLRASLVPFGQDAASDIHADASLPGGTWQTVTLPFASFSNAQSLTSFLGSIKEVRLGSMTAAGEKPARVTLKNVRLVKGKAVTLESAVKSKAAPAGGEAKYQVTVVNSAETPQSIALSFRSQGWEAFEASVEPSTLRLAPGETWICTVIVRLPGNIPPGGHESQTLLALPNGDGTKTASIAFTTACEVPHPYVLHTPARWQAVRDKVKAQPWAKAAQDELVAKADKWEVPEIARPPHNDPDDQSGPFVFPTTQELNLMAAGEAWQLTGDKRYAEKAALFLKRLSDPVEGYPQTLRACNQSFVQEGHFFQHNAMVYDMILDSGVLSAADRAQIEATFRIYMDLTDWENRGGGISNWNLSEVCGAFYCALAMQDLERAERFFSGPGGIVDQLAKGTMDDGWWYECAISYNVWCSTEFLQAALAYQPWGVNFLDMWVPASYANTASISTKLAGGSTSGSDARPFGMSNEIKGPLRRPYRQICDLWNSLVPFIDYRGVMFGVNDSTERFLTGDAFDIAYTLFRDPAYAALVKLGGGKRDLLYGVPELPANAKGRETENAYADNAGVAMLRSQTPGRPQSEQIQAVLRYGSHGWAHGHFDRASLLSLMRYGRSFYSPESIFYVYEPFMYKFYGQTSLNHNMVVVDEKMQEAADSKRLLFHTGSAMQATAVETEARWSNPPYGGMVYDYVPVKTFEEKTWREGRFVPIPKDAPKYGSVTGFTEKILQRRLMIVTDDYVVLADYLKGSAPHTFESLFSLKGVSTVEAASKKPLRHDAQWNPDPVGSAQFVTDCQWTEAQGPVRIRSQMLFGSGADTDGMRETFSTPGVLNLDVINAWPAKKQEVMVGQAPEFIRVEKRLFYTVRGGGKVLAEGKFGAWILGKAEIDVPLEGIPQLELETRVDQNKLPTVFWANARIVTRGGKEIPLSQLKLQQENIAPVPQPDKDYRGGPVKIQGIEYTSSTPGQPKDDKKPALLRLDLAGLDATRFKATLGSDFPVGDEAQRRKTVAFRTQGTSARYLTVLEPYETKSMVRTVTAESADTLRVELADGRVQELRLNGMEGNGTGLGVSLTETRDGKTLRNETTAQ